MDIDPFDCRRASRFTMVCGLRKKSPGEPGGSVGTLSWPVGAATAPRNTEVRLGHAGERGLKAMGLFRRGRKKRAEAEAPNEAESTASSGQGIDHESQQGAAQGHADPPLVATPTVLNPTALRDALQELYAEHPTREGFAQQALQIFARSGSI